ncbi:hypothetical protein D3C75_808680 [compost metagenome]
MLELTFAEPDHQPGTDHGRTGQTTHEVHPAQHRAGEMAHVQTEEPAGDCNRQRALRHRLQLLTRYAIEGHGAAEIVAHTVGPVELHHHRSIGVAGVVHRHLGNPATWPKSVCLLQQRRQRHQQTGTADG